MVTSTKVNLNTTSFTEKEYLFRKVAMSAMANGKEAKDVEKEKRPLKMAQSTTASWKMDMDMGNGIVKVKVSTTGSGKTTRRTISG